MNAQGYIRVRETMTGEVRIIDGLATVAEALELMRRHDVSSLVIERRHEGDEFGIVEVDDIAARVMAPDLSPERTNVYEIMSKPVVTVDADMDVKYAIRLLARLGLSRALVTEGNRLIGIVTLRDMVLCHVGRGEAAVAAAD